MAADLSILGITPEQIRVMQAERENRAPWAEPPRGDDDGFMVINKTLVPRSANRKYPFKTMKRGETFLVRYRGRGVEQLANSVNSCLNYAARKYGMEFTTHRTKEGIEVKRK